MKFILPSEIPAAFNSGSNFDDSFIIKYLAIEFEGKSEFLGETTEKYKTFSSPIEKEVKDVNEKLIKMLMEVL